jgi:hypothetical protein
MKHTYKSLNIPLYRQNFSGFRFVVASIALSIIYIEPSTSADWVIAILIMAPTFWLVFVGPRFLSEWQSHSKYVFIGWFIFAAKLALFWWVISIVVPYAKTVLKVWLHA